MTVSISPVSTRWMLLARKGQRCVILRPDFFCLLGNEKSFALARKQTIKTTLSDITKERCCRPEVKQLHGHTQQWRVKNLTHWVKRVNTYAPWTNSHGSFLPWITAATKGKLIREIQDILSAWCKKVNKCASAMQGSCDRDLTYMI